MPVPSRVSVVTERGQVSIPAHLRKELGIEKGQRLLWEKAGENEIRILVLQEPAPRGARAMLGFARRFRQTREDPGLDGGAPRGGELMPWVVDTCVLIDVLDEDPAFGIASAETLEACAEDGLVVCPMTYAELSPAFQGDGGLQDEFLTGVGVDFRQDWVSADTLLAHRAWGDFVQRRRSAQLSKRPLADILIGAFSARFQGLITRNRDDLEPLFPDLVLRIPG